MEKISFLLNVRIQRVLLLKQYKKQNVRNNTNSKWEWNCDFKCAQTCFQSASRTICFILVDKYPWLWIFWISAKWDFLHRIWRQLMSLRSIFLFLQPDGVIQIKMTRIKRCGVFIWTAFYGAPFSLVRTTIIVLRCMYMLWTDITRVCVTDRLIPVFQYSTFRCSHQWPSLLWLSRIDKHHPAAISIFLNRQWFSKNLDVFYYRRVLCLDSRVYRFLKKRPKNG